MAWRPDYVTLVEVKDYIGITGDDETHDVKLARDIASASRAVDRECRRQFGSSVTPVDRFYTPQFDPVDRYWFVVTDDVAQTQGAPIVVSLDDGTYTYATDVTASARPLDPNAAADGRPVQGYRLAGSNWGRVDELRVRAVFGWDSVPVSIKDATLLQTQRFFKRGDAPFGIAGSPSGEGEMRLLSKVDPDVALMLRGYTRRWSAA